MAAAPGRGSRAPGRGAAPLSARRRLPRSAVADLTGRLPVMRVSDRLTEIAELIIARAMELALAPDHRAVRACRMCGEGAAAAAGEHLRGRLRQARRPGAGLRLGPGPGIPARLARRAPGDRMAARAADRESAVLRAPGAALVHLLTMHSAAGRLYEVDVRLRPSGKGGLLVTSIDAFAEYQRREAWTWEHQALLHARAVAGAPALCARIRARCASRCCATHVRRETLRDEVRAMRERMRRELSKGGTGQFDIKQDAGGIADIEFLAQYWALQWAPRLSAGGDVLRHHPPARVGGLRRSGAAGDRGCAHGGLPRVPHADAPPVARGRGGAGVGRSEFVGRARRA